jgi:hypothetical protein
LETPARDFTNTPTNWCSSNFYLHLIFSSRFIYNLNTSSVIEKILYGLGGGSKSLLPGTVA